MFTKYIQSLNKREGPVVLSITNTTESAQVETIIQRNSVRDEKDIYIRAREIYFRARRQRRVRAVSIL